MQHLVQPGNSTFHMLPDESYEHIHNFWLNTQSVQELRKRGKQPANDLQSAEVQQLCVLAQELHSP